MTHAAEKRAGGSFGRVLAQAAAIFTLVAGLTAGVRAEAPVVLFDEGHGQRFLIQTNRDLDLSGLARTFHEQQFSVTYGRGALTPEALEEVDVLVISGPFVPYGAEEIAVIEEFLNRGGRLSIMLHIGQPLLPLLESLDITVSGGVVNERENVIASNPLDFHVTRLEPHPLHDELERYALYGAWGLEATSGKARLIARTGPKAWLDTSRDRTHTPDEPQQQVGVVAVGEFGKGSYIVFGDDAIFQNRFLKDENLTLARNLARWLYSGGK